MTPRGPAAAQNAVALCECVAAAKARYPSTKAFGAWWDAQAFEMNSDTRAALVAMGQQMDRARDVLAVTERRSIQHVYRHEFQLRHVTKSPKETPAPKAGDDTLPVMPWQASVRKQQSSA